MAAHVEQCAIHAAHSQAARLTSCSHQKCALEVFGVSSGFGADPLASVDTGHGLRGVSGY